MEKAEENLFQSPKGRLQTRGGLGESHMEYEKEYVKAISLIQF
ncbi:hypothetical protein [Anaerocellum danielii]|uniref:Uncharacterized protein n=1 Tax=Anaerocellum danielii TaxID=1387557 RepID=A0ABZ0U2V9_9FIRM|nr:hypothetical protein [Caldicellulosiruptor danielii]WPX08789.1 hypothetical protein SOJ16_002699 [Caldicellulosiruptor danielii]